MRANNVLGIIFSNAYDQVLSEITSLRAMGSVPFCSRYRLIDFPLSSMVNCGITKVGIVTKSNYQSLMDHLGTGKPWDLSRKREGMFILPPFHSQHSGLFKGKIQALEGVMNFITHSKEEYILFSDCNVVCNYDFKKLMKFHDEKDADISIICKHGVVPKLEHTMKFDMDETGRIRKIAVLGDEITDTEEIGNYCTNIILMRKSLLERLVKDAISLNYTSFAKDIFQRNVSKLKIYGLESEGFVEVIDGLQSYFDITRMLLKPENMKSLFDSQRPVFTKVRDEMPAIYGLGSKVSNSLVADGCVIDGEVENSVIFRGVRIAKGAVVKNSIIMQDSYISEGVHLDNVISDKLVVIKPGKVLSGASTYPMYIGKSIVI